MNNQLDARFWGRPELLSDVNRNFGKGNWFAARPRYVREVYGEAALSSVAGALSEEARRYFFKPPLAFSWLPIKFLYEMDYAIWQGPMCGELAEMKTFGASIAAYDLNWLYQAFLRLSSPSFLLRQSGLICRTYIKESNIQPEVSAGSAHFTLSGAPLARYMCAFGVPGWTGAAIVAAGGREVSIEHHSCVHLGGSSCQWRLRWSE